MIVCGRCGFSNELGSGFCGSCGSFLEWTGESTAEPPVAAPPSPPGSGVELPYGEPVVPPPAPVPSVPAAPPVASIPGGIACPSCGTINDPGRSFCHSCAAELVPWPRRQPAAPIADGEAGGPPAGAIIAGVLVVLLVAVAAVAGAQMGLFGGGETAQATATPAPIPTAPASPTPTARPTAPPIPTAPAGLGPGVLAAGWPAIAVSDRIRVRSLPIVADESTRFNPLLAIGQEILVMGGPTPGSGYQWYRVIPYGPDGTPVGPYGWVAAGSKQGDPWFETRPFDCPAGGDVDFDRLRDLGPTRGLVCFGSNELRFTARLVPCECEGGGPGAEPAWLISLHAATLRLEPPEGGSPADWIVPRFHPSAFPSGDPGVPLDATYAVTAHYDDPAAGSCTIEEFQGANESQADLCRIQLVVTAVEAIASRR